MIFCYSKDIVYNNFPWPEANAGQQEKIARLAQAVLDARAAEAGSSLAALYDPNSMPAQLAQAHQALDRAVIRLYGWPAGISEPEMAARLFGLYQRLAGEASPLSCCKSQRHD